MRLQETETGFDTINISSLHQLQRHYHSTRPHERGIRTMGLHDSVLSSRSLVVRMQTRNMQTFCVGDTNVLEVDRATALTWVLLLTGFLKLLVNRNW